MTVPFHTGKSFPATVLLGLTCLVFWNHCQSASAQKAAADKVDFFEKKIRPILVEHCYACHSAKAKQLEANLRLDSLAGILKGGDSGPAIRVRDSANSLLISALEYDQYEMPPDGRLPEQVITDFKNWITDGAVSPKSFRSARESKVVETKVDWDQAKKHWAFRPVKAPTVPVVRDDDWNSNPIDAFVCRELKRKQQRAVDLASKRVLIRRVYLDLIGLPPTPVEIQQFLDDKNPDAYSKLIDRLLESPRYGERWGRHWLDVVRYADSNGADENHPYPFAWRYRNYVIDSFNQDRPFDEFVVEQLAGDLLPQSNDRKLNNRRLTATTFLALGIKIDAEKDQEKKRADIIDEQLDTIGRSLMGMTIGCARCHDHKFDPIPTSDYYALSGILRSTELRNRKLSSPEEDSINEKIRLIHSQIEDTATRETGRILGAAKNKIPEFINAAQRVAAWRQAHIAEDVFVRVSPVVQGSNLKPIGELINRSEFKLPGVWLDAESFARGEAAIDKENYGKDIGIVSDRGGGKTWVEYDVDLPSEGVYQIEFRYAAKNTRPGKLSINGKLVNQQSMAQTTGGWHPEQQKWFVEGRYEFKAGQNQLKFEVAPYMSHLDQFLIVRVDQYKQEKQKAKQSEELIEPRKLANNLKLDYSALLVWAEVLGRYPAKFPTLGDGGSGLSSGESERLKNLTKENGLLATTIREDFFAEPVRKQLGQLRADLAKQSKQLEKFAMNQVMAVDEGQVADASIFVRGNHRQQGQTVSRRFLTIVAGQSQQGFPTTQSGRLELARAIVDPGNSLTARVIANRIWRWHFGRGIVSDMDNFGLSGTPPSHPELLDFLATYLVENQWSIKKLHRLLVNSRTYRTASDFSDEQAKLDPENRNYWRWQPRRMEAETIRDSLLAISGRLKNQIGGPPIKGVTTANPSPQDLLNNRKVYQDSPRRSVYQPVIRTNLYTLFALFDFPNPAAPKGNRDSTTVPTQALFLMNNPWVRELAGELAERAKSKHGQVRDRIQFIYVSILGRNPSASEQELAIRFLAKQPDGWASFCHTLFMSNEFLYIQ